MQTAEQLKQGFEYRNYLAQRRLKLAAEAGRLSVMGAAEDDGHERRRKDEIESLLAETMDGRVNTEYPFRIHEGQLIAEDGEAIEDLALRGHQEAIKIASQDNFYAPFLPQRTKFELDEIRQDQAMARGETTYNTTIKFSPYTQELDTSDENRAKLIAANQKPYWQRGMFRLKHWDQQDQKLYMFTVSIDNSSVEFLQSVAKEVLDYDFQAQDSTGMLGETISLNIKDESWRSIPSQVIKSADTKLAQQRGGQWLQGRKLSEAEDTQKFVQSQKAIVDHVLEMDSLLAAEYSSFETYQKALQDVLYNQAALLEKLMMDNAGVFAGDVAVASAAAGFEARGLGKVYDACGLLLEGNSESELAQLAAKTGYEAILLLLGYEFDSKYCPCCLPKPKPGKKVKAWRKENKLGCKDCGHTIDVCTKKVIKQGKKPKKR